jgi:hypothetical protein
MGGMEGNKNERAFYGRIIRRARSARERAAQSLRLSRAARKNPREEADAAQGQRRFRRRR